MRRCIDTIVHDQAQGPVPVAAAPDAVSATPNPAAPDPAAPAKPARRRRPAVPSDPQE